MRDQIRTWILQQVKANGGISNLRLWINISSMSTRFTSQEYHNVLDDMVRDREIIKLEFSDSNTYGNNKSVFFLRGTRFMNLKEFVSERTGDESIEETNSSKGDMANKSSSDI